MIEHEKLKAICYKIGYNPVYPYNDIVNTYYDIVDEKHTRRLDVREIIFTQEFMDKFIAYRKNWNLEPYPIESLIWTFAKELLWWIEERKWHLNNPTEYLFNLLELWQKKNNK